MNTRLLGLMPLLVVLMLCASCSKDVLFETEESDGGGNSTLVIKTRTNSSSGSNDAEESKVSYPVNVYVFDKDGKCVNVSTIEASNTSVTLNLNEGTYNIYSIAGATADSYELPTKENATAESVISLKAGKEHGDLMTAQNAVTLADGGTNTLTIALARKVMLLEEVTMNNIPSSVQGVSITITPLYNNICMNGSYNGNAASQTIQLTKEPSTKTWSNKTAQYLLETANNNATVAVNMTTGENTYNFSYICGSELKANYKIKINGTYTGDLGFTLTGTLEGATWAGSKDISFTFDEKGSTIKPGGGGEEEKPEPSIPTTAPAVGTLYNGCYVLKSETSGAITTVTLMTLKQTKLSEKDGNYTLGNATSINTAVNNEITSLAATPLAAEITGWRLPTQVEMKYIKENVSAINTTLSGIKDISYDRILTSYGAGDYFYFFGQSAESIATYGMGNSDKILSVGASGAYLRPVTTKTFQ